MLYDFIYILSAIGLLSLVILFHELGHFLVGKWCGIKVSTFSIGFGKPLIYWIDKKGTQWQLAWFIIGGYVKFSQKVSKHSDDMAFDDASLFKRFMTVLAGPLASFIFALLTFIFIFIAYGSNSEEPIIGEVSSLPHSFPIEVGDKIIKIDGKSVNSFSEILQFSANVSEGFEIVLERAGSIMTVKIDTLFPPLIDRVELLSPADTAGLKSGDYITSVNGKKISSFDDLKSEVMLPEAKNIRLEVIRNNTVLRFELEKRYLVTESSSGKLEEKLRIGISGKILIAPLKTNRTLLASIYDSFAALEYVIRLTVSSILGMITSDIGVNQISGPVGITYAIGETSKSGIIATFSLIGMISASIGVLNLLPVPLLDGGHLLSYLLEFILGRRIVNIIKKPLTIFGLVTILALFLIGFLNDVNRILFL